MDNKAQVGPSPANANNVSTGRQMHALSSPEALPPRQPLRRTTVFFIVLFALISFSLAAAIAWGAFEVMPHLEDEHATLFQARVFARGLVTAPLPPEPGAFKIEFVINADGHRFSKYPPGYSLLLAAGVLVHQPWIINALAAVLGLLGTFMVARDLFGEKAGLWAMFLGLFSPTFILLSGSLLSHSTCLAAVIWFVWAVLSIHRGQVRHLSIMAAAAGGLIGLAFIIRPWTAVALGLPFLFLIIRDFVLRPRASFRLYWPLVFAFILVALLLPLYNYFATGSPFANLYTLWWPSDTLGFGPRIGAHGYNWVNVLANVFTDWPAFIVTMIGWPTILGFSFAWIGILAGLFWPSWRSYHLWLVVPPIFLVCAYMAYWASGEGLYGARYYAEALPFFWILIARGLSKLPSRSGLSWITPLLVVLLTIWGSITVTWPRSQQAHGLYGISRRGYSQIASAQIHNALVFVSSSQWTDYASFSWLNEPVLAESDIIYAINRGNETNRRLIAAFPGRKVYYYDRTLVPPLSNSPHTLN
jgi:hypothetical protein